MTLSSTQLRGIIGATTTPFDAQGNINKESLQKHVQYLIDRGIKGLAPLGGTGEYPALSTAERQSVVRWTCEAAQGRVPVIAGVLATGYADALEAGRNARAAGADALMLVTPYYTIGDDDGIREYFAHYRREVDLPLVLYEIPRRTNVELSAGTVSKMAKDGSIIGIKYSGANFDKLTRVIQLTGDELAVLSGEEPLFPAQIGLGATGGVLALSNLDPQPWIKMQALVESGDMMAALQIHHRYAELISAVYSEMNPTGLKAAMHLYGFVETGDPRLPLRAAQDHTVQRIRDALSVLAHEGVLS